MLCLGSKAGLVPPSPGHHGRVCGLCSSWLCGAHRGSLVRASLLGFPLSAQLWASLLGLVAAMCLHPPRQSETGFIRHQGAEKTQATQGCCSPLIASGTPLSGFLLAKGRVNRVKITVYRSLWCPRAAEL